MGHIAHTGIRIAAQGIGSRQVIPALVRPAQPGSRIALLYLLILKHRHIAALNHVAHHLEPRFKVRIDRQKLIRTAHLAHPHVIAEGQNLRTARETDLADAPHIVAHHHIAAYQLETLTFGNKTDNILQVVCPSTDRINPIPVVFLCIRRQRRKQLVGQDSRRIDIEPEILGQLPVQVPELIGRSHGSRHLLVIDIGGSKAQFVVSLHHILLHALPDTEQSRNIAEQLVLLLDVDLSFDIQLGIVAVHDAFVERRKENNLFHDGVRRDQLALIGIWSITRPYLSQWKK